jgi:Flp pilus assembly protein TadD
MAGDRIDVLKALLAKQPTDSRLLFGLAMEYEKREQWSDVITALRTYLEHAEDEGNAWGRLGNALRRIGHDDESKGAYRTGIDVARAHGHPSMAADFEEILDDWDI